ncbi:DUF4190 domain-containing protein [Prauserella cavernicola]|uniref:DUF4190 domain-containing protein n=1 Tax=Prauserella cavernicola TaxID=2800127 RepID=A0A934QWK9_9PSEU|nr:DUF4190 domain-containing protein [Prauserella cavernicola]MBK1786638.1 DUF4190 domain-containing protein [Prauserella cavernicola]
MTQPYPPDPNQPYGHQQPSGQPSQAPYQQSYSQYGTYPQQQGYLGQYPYGQGQPDNGTGTAALVVGLVSLLLWPLAVVSIILGIVGVGKVKNGRATNKDSAVAGIVLGIFACVIAVIFFGVVLSTKD